MKKIWLLILGLLGVVIGWGITGTYGLFESNVDLEANSKLAKWVVYVNSIDVVSNNTFVIDTLNIDNDDNVMDGKMAPTSTAYFDVFINCYGTEVSVRYDLTLDFSSLDNPGLTFEGVEETNGKKLVKTGDNTYTGIITVAEISQGVIDDVRVKLTWVNDEDNNDNDYAVGSKDIRDVNIPVSVSVSQYLGEDINEYSN